MATDHLLNAQMLSPLCFWDGINLSSNCRLYMYYGGHVTQSFLKKPKDIVGYVERIKFTHEIVFKRILFLLAQSSFFMLS